MRRSLFVRESLLIKVLIVDDHALVRMGIRRLLQDLSDVTVIGEAETGEQALIMIKKSPPDVLLLDMKMPGMDGFELTRRLTKTHPHIKVIAVTSVNNSPLPSRLLQLGAMGYLTKGSGAEEMAIAIRKVAMGGKYLSGEIAQKLAFDSLSPTDDVLHDKLTEREMQVMLMIVDGMDVQDIADKLFLSAKTVNGYRYKMFEKLSLKNDVELTMYAIKHHLVDDPVNEDRF
jgi:two-component system invasion response regulator UvrY